MSSNSDWLFEENKVIGVDYFDASLAKNYDNAHGKFRYFDKEAERLFHDLQLSSGSIVLDFGCGTGGLSVPLVKKCQRVYSVDISQAMIDILKDKIDQQGIMNIAPVRSGFLTYEHEGECLDAIVCTITLHHLPDFWKQVALCRFYEMLKPGGKLFLLDVVFDFIPQDYQEVLDSWLRSMAGGADTEMVHVTKVHIKEEYSTWDWILEGMIERASFSINKKIEVMPQMKAFICSK